MCMKNLNVNAVFADIIANQKGSSVSLGDIVTKKFYLTTEEDKRKISQLSLAVFVTATQAKTPKKIDPDTVFSFDEKYEIRVRLTETYSGEFRDLTSFVLEPSTSYEAEGLCRNVFQYTLLCIFSDVELPELREKERFVIKILVRRCESDKKNWSVQSISPIRFENT